MGKQKPDSEARYRIYEDYPEARVVEKQIVFVGEGRERREAAAETRYQQRTQFWRDVDTALDEPEQNPYKKTSDDIDNESSPRKTTRGMFRYHVAQQVAATAAYRAPGHYPQQISPHTYVRYLMIRFARRRALARSLSVSSGLAAVPPR